MSDLLRACITPNFGDAMNGVFYRLLTGRQPKRWGLHRGMPPEPVHMLVGSILGHADDNTIVWGPGFIAQSEKPRGKPSVFAVRGRLSYDKLIALGINCPMVFGDPVLLYPRFYHPQLPKKYKLGIIPHYVDKQSPLLDKFQDAHVINIGTNNVNTVVDQVLQCECIASSSLHGLIIADAYKIPNAWIQLSNKVYGKGFKFRDHFSAINKGDMEPLIVNHDTTMEMVYDKMSNTVDIDLDLLIRSCPLVRS